MDQTSPFPDPLHGLNPESLMAAAAMATDGGADTILLQRADLPGIDEIAAAFPDLEILDLIGHGGMSAVFRARQPKLDRVIALKVLPKSLAGTPGFPERFTREGRVLARLNHPHIVTVHDFGESGGFCYLTMEYVDGVNLRQAMRAGRFTPEQALNIIPTLCDALQFAHSQGVLHRDIKPENILLDSKGRVKIADFGIAKILDEKDGDAMLLTQSGVKLGTAPYMAPEQIEKPASVDHRADIYSLGVVFYEMLTGELPLGRFAAPSEIAAVGGNIDEIVFRALEKERTRRQQSAGEFKTQIESIGSLSAPAQRALARRFQSFEYKSKRRLFGMPLLHVTQGIDPATGKARVARGFFAFGERAVGVIAFGGYARGWFACGGMAVGGVAFGGLSIGLISWGGVALALLLSLGGLSVGMLASGGFALGWQAIGGFAMGWDAVGGVAVAHHGMGGRVIATHVVKVLTEMPWPLQVLTKASWLTSMGAFLWLPLMLPMMIIPPWARRRLELEAAGRPQESLNGVFWTIPAVMVPGAVLWWMIYRWAQTGGGLQVHYIFATMTECIGLLLFLLSLPLWLRLVPMNSIYGVRLPSTLNSDKRWYDVNAYSGKQGFTWSLVLMIAGMAGFYQLPRHQDSYCWAAVIFSLVALATWVISTLWWIRRHPADGSVAKRHHLAWWAGQVVVAVVIAFFIKSFIAAPYRIAGGAEAGVIKGSHWMVSRLDTGFEPGNLIIFQHESGQYWTARVVKREDKGLLLKRGGAVEEFFMPWEKIAGKMLFAHFSPDAQVEADVATAVQPQTVTAGTSNALEKKPVLRFTRLKRNGTDWRWPVYSVDGRPLNDEGSKTLITPSGSGGVTTQNADDCWLELWFEHPDFDRHSQLRVDIAHEDGSPLKDRDSSTSAPIWSSTHPHPPLASFVISPGPAGRLPAAVQITLRYSIGPWQDGQELPSNFNGSMALGDGCLLAGFGDDHEHRAFVSWSKEDDDMLYDAVARLKNGGRLGSSGWSRSGHPGKNIVESVSFPVLLRDVESFQIRNRKVQTVTFAKVVIPPLSE